MARIASRASHIRASRGFGRQTRRPFQGERRPDPTRERRGPVPDALLDRRSRSVRRGLNPSGVGPGHRGAPTPARIRAATGPATESALTAETERQRPCTGCPGCVRNRPQHGPHRDALLGTRALIVARPGQLGPASDPPGGGDNATYGSTLAVGRIMASLRTVGRQLVQEQHPEVPESHPSGLLPRTDDSKERRGARGSVSATRKASGSPTIQSAPAM
jgi:hypothetical protein